jgi:hypothetical protein
MRKLLIVVLFIVGATAAHADVPQHINYQGILLDDVGDPVTTSKNVAFRIYTDPVAGSLEWSESRSVTPDAGGRFNILLGEVNAIDDEVFSGADRWLEIQILGDSPMSPRIRLVSVPYAFRIATVDGSNGGQISGDVSITGDITGGGRATIGGAHTHLSAGGFMAGTENYADGSQTVVAGGNFNAAIGTRATVGGGYLNGAADDYATVAGGFSNVANLASAVSGGRYNYARGSYSAIAGGGGLSLIDSNSVQGDYSSIGGGRRNVVIGFESTIGGGNNNSVEGAEAVVAGGEDNEASATNSTVGGGKNNVASGIESTISGGSNNIADAYLSTIGGGISNKATGGRSTIAGGEDNEADGDRSTIGGGDQNTSTNTYTTVGGGFDNDASAVSATVSGGRRNSATGDYSFVGGGYQNKCNGDYCAIPGGDQDTIAASSERSMAFGRGVFVNNDYRVVFFDGTNHGRLGINRDDRQGGILRPIHVGTSTSNGNGAYLTNGGTWTNGSSREFKESFESIDSDDLLQKIATLQIDAWNYKGTSERHIGPVAEEFVAAFNVGAIREDGVRDDKYLSTVDVAGVALAAVKELHEQNQKLDARIVELQNLVEQLLEQQK